MERWRSLIVGFLVAVIIWPGSLFGLSLFSDGRMVHSPTPEMFLGFIIVVIAVIFALYYIVGWTKNWLSKFEKGFALGTWACILTFVLILLVGS